MAVTGNAVAKDGTQATVTYVLRDKQAWLEYKVEISNGSPKAQKTTIEDSVRCDGSLYKTGTLGNDFYAEDAYFGQCYLFTLDGHKVTKSGGRNMLLRPSGEKKPELLASGATYGWSGKLFCSQGRPGVQSLRMAEQEGGYTDPVLLTLKSPLGPIQHASVTYSSEGREIGTMLTGVDGAVRTRLRNGNYTVKIRAIGYEPKTIDFEIRNRQRSDNLIFEAPSRVRGEIVDEAGKPIAAKVQFIGVQGTASPDFGPDSAIYAIKNVVYCAHGRFEQPLDPGIYRVIVSHGPEYDAHFEEQLVVEAGKLSQLTVALPRVVNTEGWISSEFHSHSSPSGDNVSHQTGRVLNLLAEHLEFAPCTEHIESTPTRTIYNCLTRPMQWRPVPVWNSPEGRFRSITRMRFL